MALTQRLEIRQSHALVMTPQLMQAIKLLQLSNLDLAAYVEGELERNPLLERTEGEGEGDRRAAERRRFAGGGRAGRTGRRATGDGDNEAAARRARLADLDDVPPADADAATLALERRGCRPAIPNGPAPAPAAATTATTISKPSSRPRRTLADHLAEQLALAIADPARRMIGQYLIDWSTRPATSPAISRRSARSSARRRPRSKPCSAILQGFDPPGVCARNLTECLAHPAQGARPLRSRDGRRWSRISTCSPSAISPRCAGSAA